MSDDRPIGWGWHPAPPGARFTEFARHGLVWTVEEDHSLLTRWANTPDHGGAALRVILVDLARLHQRARSAVCARLWKLCEDVNVGQRYDPSDPRRNEAVPTPNDAQLALERHQRAGRRFAELLEPPGSTEPTPGRDLLLLLELK